MAISDYTIREMVRQRAFEMDLAERRAMAKKEPCNLPPEAVGLVIALLGAFGGDCSIEVWRDKPVD